MSSAPPALKYAPRRRRVRKPAPWWPFIILWTLLLLGVGHTLAFNYCHGPGHLPVPDILSSTRKVAGVAFLVGVLGSLLLVPVACLRWNSVSITSAVAQLVLAVFAVVTFWPQQTCYDHRCHGAYPVMSAHLSGISKAALGFASEHNDRYPQHVAALLIDGSISTRMLILRSHSTPYTPPATLPALEDWATIARDVDAHCDIVYIGGDLTLTPSGPDPAIIVAYTKRLPVFPRGRILAYQDGNRGYVENAHIPAKFAASNAARAKLGLPPVVLDGPPPAIPTPPATGIK